MAETSYSCDVRQGFNFEKDAQVTLGYINAIKIAGTDLAADISVTDPESANMEGKLKVFGVVSHIYWTGGYADPIEFGCQVSINNKPKIQEMTHKTLSNTNVEVTFTIYDYDPVQKKYYKCFHTDGAPVIGLIEKSGGQLNMTIDADQSMEVTSPKNFAFNLGVMPVEESNQALQMATSVNLKFAKQWGVEVK